MSGSAFSMAKAKIEQKAKLLDQKLDQYATGQTIHFVANLKASYRLAIGLHIKGGYPSSPSLVRESEADIMAFVSKAKLQSALFPAN